MREIIVHEPGGPEVFQVEQAPMVGPNEGEMCIQMTYSGINYTSVEKRRGNYHGVVMDWSPPYQAGLEGVGTITEINGRLEGWSTGERVGMIKFQGGTWSDQATADFSEAIHGTNCFFNPQSAELVFKIPDGISDKKAAAIPVSFLTAYGILKPIGEIEPSDTVLVHSAAGGVGNAATQIATWSNATVIGIASNEDKIAFATRMGADHTINYATNSITTEIDDICDDTVGIDIALESIGGRTFKQTLAVMNESGSIITYGVSSGTPGIVTTPDLIFSGVSIHGFHLLLALLNEKTRTSIMDGITTMFEMVERDTYHVEIDEVFDMTDVSSAHEYLESRNSIGNIVMAINP
ncbi:quinone oxidoreductase family protein [Halocatena halophila]|uniref:quinone oxidoreductase family protein n=1 Tax=Halocatena halophila TaxID=2814576 RepID=UPI002ED0DA68